MAGRDAGLIHRALGRIERTSRRFRERVEGMPLRRIERARGLPVPPGRLIHLVANTEDVGWFLHTGALAAQCIRDTLAKHGLALEACSSLLDFGCGAGRVIRHWAGLEGPEVHGVDYNPALLSWCREHLPFAQFHQNGLQTPLPLPDAHFDFAYALSVFTHLDEPLQHFWIQELARALKPGGHLLFTTHGDHYLSHLTPEDQARYGAGQTVVIHASREGSNDCAAFHPERYVRETLARGYDVVDMIPEGALGNPSQDLYLLRKKI